MILRHAREPMDGQPVENTFEAIDERRGARLGACTIFVHKNAELFPTRPIRIYLELEGAPVPDALLGAALARAKELARQSGEPCRIFTQAEPEDELRLNTLSCFGFKDNDGLVRLQRDLPANEPAELPVTCVVVKDDLDDPIEQEYFLERYNQLFNEEYDSEWLESLRSQEGFTRILIVSPTGMVGETLIWQEAGRGMVGWIHTAKKWRRKGIARLLMDIACEEFEARCLPCACAEVQAKIPAILNVMEHIGFRQAKLMLRYPGIDMG